MVLMERLSYIIYVRLRYAGDFNVRMDLELESRIEAVPRMILKIYPGFYPLFKMFWF